MNISGQLNLTLSINGTVFPIMSVPGFQCIVCTTVRQSLPAMRFILPDPNKLINTSLPITDGTPLIVTLNDDNNTSIPPATFRAFGTPKRGTFPENPTISCYTINAILDAIPYIRANPNQAITGPSHTVISQIASANNLNLKTNVIGNDSMTWLPGRKTWAGFTDHISAHSFIDTSGVTATGVDEQKNLYYMNVSTLFNKLYTGYIFYGVPQQQMGFGSGSNTPPTFAAVQYKAINHSGIYNSLGAYGQRTVQTGLNGVVNKHLNTNATTYNNSLDVNADVSAAVQPVSRMNLTASDAGNSHANYVAARHQNKRLKCTYTQNIYVMLYQTTNINILDLVKFTASSDQTSTDSLVNGYYVVTAKSRCVYNNRYYEKIELCNNGPQAGSNSGLISS
jgi:hypothetical protein